MRALLSDPAPAEFEALLERRRRWGADRRDEVWQGVLHVNPAPHGRHAKLQAQLLRLLGAYADAAGLTALGDFNLGDRDDYRIPDAGLLRPGPDELYYATVALAIEILSPGGETWDKLPFYAAHGVDELLILDPAAQTIRWLTRSGERYEPIARSGLIDLSTDELADQLDWPATEPSA
jgi:Uma2 family endonuclease